MSTTTRGRPRTVPTSASPTSQSITTSRQPTATRASKAKRLQTSTSKGSSARGISNKSTASKEKVAVPRRHPATKKATPTIKRRAKRKKKKGVPGQKRYRRVKVVRPCVVRLVFLLPLAIISIERYLGLVISLDDVRDVYYEQMGIDPWEVPQAKGELIGQVAELVNLTFAPQIQCPMGQRRMISAHNPQFYGLKYRKVPNIVHQAAQTRCLTRNFDRASIQWAFRRYSYYIHDKEAVMRLLHSDYPEFPQLRLISDSCLAPPLLFGLWRYLVLWCYGGVVADLNTYPSQFNRTTISNEDDGFFLMEEGSETLTTLVMAVSPRHPLMYYAIQRCISNILKMRPNTMYSPREIVGEGALNQAMADFRRNMEKKRFFRKNANIPTGEGTWEGKNGRSLRVGGSLRGPDEEGIITPIFISPIGKSKEFEKIGMQDLNKSIPGINCLGRLVPTG